jgi:hypothetical protein
MLEHLLPVHTFITTQIGEVDPSLMILALQEQEVEFLEPGIQRRERFDCYHTIAKYCNTARRGVSLDNFQPFD